MEVQSDTSTNETLHVAIFTFNLEAQLYGCSCRKSTLRSRLNRLVRRRYIKSSFVAEYLDVVSAPIGRLPDVIVINLQEANLSSHRKSDKLLKCFLKEVLRRNDNYTLSDETVAGVNSCGLVGVRMGIISSREYNSTTSFTIYRSPAAWGQMGKGSVIADMHVHRRNEHYHINLVNTHLPFEGGSEDHGLETRNKALDELLQYCDRTVLDDACLTRFLAGDLNYRICFDGDEQAEAEYLELVQSGRLTCEEMEKYVQYDQLQPLFATLLVDYQEGLDDSGPSFLPTCKLTKTLTNKTARPYQIYKGGGTRIPSWCDRILHYGNVDCLDYGSFDHGTTTRSDHRPVYGVYQINVVCLSDCSSWNRTEYTQDDYTMDDSRVRTSINGVSSSRRGSSISALFGHQSKQVQTRKVRRLTGQFTQEHRGHSVHLSSLPVIYPTSIRRPSLSLPELPDLEMELSTPRDLPNV